MKLKNASNPLSVSRGITSGVAAVLAVWALPALGQSSGIPGVLAPGIVIELVQEGFVFTEGPVGTDDGGLYFSDLRGGRTHYLDPSGKILVVREPTNGANGLALTADGAIVSAEGAAKRITKRAKDGTIAVLTEGIPGRPLLGPNDLIADAKGGIYFTDPGLGPFPLGEIRPTRVYYLPRDAKAPVVVDADIPIPNGLSVTNDGKTLVVDNTHGSAVFAYDIQTDGTVKNRRTFAMLHDIPANEPSGADGIAIDREDRIYVSSLTGVQVFDAKGQYLGTITVPRQPANVAFAGADKQTLFVTAREGLYRIKLLAKGPSRLGK